MKRGYKHLRYIKGEPQPKRESSLVNDDNIFSSDSKRVTTLGQQELLCDFLEQNLDIARGRVAKTKGGRSQTDALWEECAQTLNSEGGPYRSTKEWQRYWTDMKSRVKIRIRKFRRDGIKVSEIDERIGKILGISNFDPIPEYEEEDDPDQDPLTEVLKNYCLETKNEPSMTEDDITFDRLYKNQKLSLMKEFCRKLGSIEESVNEFNTKLDNIESTMKNGFLSLQAQLAYRGNNSNASDDEEPHGHVEVE